MLAIDRTSQTFGNVTVNQSSAAVAITVTNHGDRQTSAITFTPSGANLDQFALNSDCGAVLMPNQSCHVNATFKPTSAGDKHAHFVVAATMGGMVAADLSGTGTPPGTVTISADAPANGDCGAALIGATSATVATYTVKNVGTSATGTPTVSTSDSTQFVASGCAAALQTNETCTVSVQFTAKQRGQQTASVSVSATPGDLQRHVDVGDRLRLGGRRDDRRDADADGDQCRRRQLTGAHRDQFDGRESDVVHHRHRRL
jgi:hypothetical protein